MTSTRAPRRHPATAALEEIRGWRRRWPIPVETEEHAIAVEAWLRKVAKAQPAPAGSTPGPWLSREAA